MPAPMPTRFAMFMFSYYLIDTHQLLADTNLTNCEFLCGSFFDYNFPVKFDVIFDYTFFCAIEPTLRPQWGSRMAEIMNQGGRLITLMFPLGTHTDGPPFAVQPEHYSALLEPNFKLISIEDTKESHPGREEKEKIAVWERN